MRSVFRFGLIMILIRHLWREETIRKKRRKKKKKNEKKESSEKIRVT